MALSQDWCLQCGAGARGSIGSPGWRSTATILAVTVLLALGAAAAGYAALSKKTPKPPTVTTTVAQAPVTSATTTTPTITTPTISTPSTSAKIPLPLGTTVKPPKILLPLGTGVKLPKITPPGSLGTSTTPTTNTTGSTGTGTNTTSTPSTSTTGGSGTAGESQQAAILLDTNAASTYNPYNYPVAEFGDPSLILDGDMATGWTAEVNPTRAPKMAEGLLIDLKTRQKLKAIELATASLGMTVQVYGANAHTAPTSITDPAWVPLSHSQVVTKKHIRIKLRNATRAFRFVTLWISQAPAASVGTPAAPGHVSVNELELFAAG